jgi:ABC-type glycerol-3-phosphate transport system substrate-binding protein
MKLVAPIALVAVMLVTAGCGSTEPTNASFAAKADAICASLNLAAAGTLSGAGGAAVKSEETLLSTAITKLQVVSVPLDRGAQYEAFLYGAEYAQALLRDLAAAEAAHDSAKVASIEAHLSRVEHDGNTSATEAGLKGCDLIATGG